MVEPVVVLLRLTQLLVLPDSLGPAAFFLSLTQVLVLAEAVGKPLLRVAAVENWDGSKE
jgi:hypothetical protein